MVNGFDVFKMTINIEVARRAEVVKISEVVIT